jgi:glyoxylase-like metal-dependent hydrolase (beta-lactamase superfamily II)
MPPLPRLAALAASLVPCLAAAHAGPRLAAAPPAKPQAAKIHRVEKVADDVYAILTDRGGNIGLVVGERFAVLVDDQFEDLVPGLLAAVRSVTDRPLKYVVNTHHHGDHTGGNVVLEKQVQAIVAHHNVRRRMRLAQDGAAAAAKPGGLPELVVGGQDPKVQARLDIHLGNVELHVVHFGAAHTDGDIIVGIPQRHVAHLGDVFFNGYIPYIDTSAGGSLAGLIETVDTLLSFIPEDARLIPGHGPVGGKKDLARYREFLGAVQGHVSANAGKSGKELAASFDRKAFPDVKELAPFLTWDGFFDLAAGRTPAR